MQCESPGAGYVTTEPATLDCDDSLATGSSINPYVIEVSTNGIDDDCDGQVDEPLVAIGDLRDGGIVFWVDPADNTKGKVCALEDVLNEDGETELNWADAISYSNGYTNFDTGTGVYSNWYLPSKDELQLMYVNLERFECSTNTPWGTNDGNCATSKANFTRGNYWSSSVYNSNSRWFQYFGYNYQGVEYRTNSYYVRAVRAFSLDDDLDGDGYVNANDCNDTDAAINPATVWFIGVDTDGDTFFGSTTSLMQCESPGAGYVTTEPATLDCDDSLAEGSSINPYVIEVSTNGIDDNCDGQVDEPAAAIGDLRDGGIVFWVDPADNMKGKVCALEDAPTTLDWADAISYSNGYTNSDTGTGVYSNWHLPSKDELQLMYANLERFECSKKPLWNDSNCATSKANFTRGNYWSSTVWNSNTRWFQYFGYHHQGVEYRTNSYYVRAVRAF
jgi:hypothetical protein